jgi:transposase-like protein
MTSHFIHGVKCPHCKKEISKVVKCSFFDDKKGNNFRCPHCHEVVEIKTKIVLEA